MSSGGYRDRGFRERGGRGSFRGGRGGFNHRRYWDNDDLDRRKVNILLYGCNICKIFIPYQSYRAVEEEVGAGVEVEVIVGVAEATAVVEAKAVVAVPIARRKQKFINPNLSLILQQL